MGPAADRATDPTRLELSNILNSRSVVGTGFGVIAAFILLFFVWGGTMSLSSAAIAPGTVGVEGDKKTIQHLDGGVVKIIHARDGDRITAGAPLVTLETNDLQARHDELDFQHVRLRIHLARCLTERTNGDDVVLGEALAKRLSEPAVAQVYESQRQVLQARRDLFSDSLDTLRAQIDELEEAGRGARLQATNLQAKLELVTSELAEYRRMEGEGLVTRSQVYELLREQADLRIDIDDARAAAASTAAKRSQVESAIAELSAVRRKEIIEEGSVLRSQIDALAQQLKVVTNALQRSVIRSPINGLVVSSQVSTIGGVLLPGQTVMEIVPAKGRLLIDSRVDPKDRDAIAVGHEAEVRFSAFDRRSSRPVSGKVSVISADRLVDQTTQQPYYQTKIELTEDPTRVLKGASIYPGMQAEVLIATGEQTLLDYLLSPVLRSFDRAMRED